MKTNRTAYPENFMVRRVDNKRGGAGSCPNVNLSGGNATRAEAATILMRFLESVAK